MAWYLKNFHEFREMVDRNVVLRPKRSRAAIIPVLVLHHQRLRPLNVIEKLPHGMTVKPLRLLSTASRTVIAGAKCEKNKLRVFWIRLPSVSFSDFYRRKVSRHPPKIAANRAAMALEPFACFMVSIRSPAGPEIQLFPARQGLSGQRLWLWLCLMVRVAPNFRVYVMEEMQQQQPAHRRGAATAADHIRDQREL